MLRDYIALPLPVHILCFGSLINRAGSFVLIFLTIYASEEMGFGIGFATACMGVFGLGSIIGSMLGGQLADQFGRRRVMVVALIGGAGLLLLIGAMENRWAFMAAVGLFTIVFMQGMSTLPIYIRQSGFSNLQFGLLMSINGLLIFLLQLPLTHWLARFNAMQVVIVSGVLIAIGFGLCVFPGGFAFIALSVAIWTLGEILQAPFKHSIVTELAPPDLRARYLGLFNMCYGFAMTIGAPLGGMVLSAYGPTKLWGGTFVIAIAAVSLYVAIQRSVTRRIESAADEVTEAEFATVASAQ